MQVKKKSTFIKTMPFDFGLFSDFNNNLTAPVNSFPAGGEFVTSPDSQLNKASAGLPAWFTPLPASSKAPRRNRLGGRTMPLDEAKKLSDVAHLDVDSFPSISLDMGPGKSAEVSITRHSQYWQYFTEVDKESIWAIQDEMYHAYQSYSHGAYSTRMLAKMGHPYGYGEVEKSTGRKVRRRVPRSHGGVSLGHVKGVRGSVPTLSVINSQSGFLAASWQEQREELADGYVLKFINTAKTKKGFPYAWALAVGTVKMQPHGPWTEVATSYLKRLDAAHHHAVMRARHAALSADLSLFYAQGQFGGEIL